MKSITYFISSPQKRYFVKKCFGQLFFLGFYIFQITDLHTKNEICLTLPASVMELCMYIYEKSKLKNSKVNTFVALRF